MLHKSQVWLSYRHPLYSKMVPINWETWFTSWKVLQYVLIKPFLRLWLLLTAISAQNTGTFCSGGLNPELPWSTEIVHCPIHFDGAGKAKGMFTTATKWKPGPRQSYPGVCNCSAISSSAAFPSTTNGARQPRLTITQVTFGTNGQRAKGQTFSPTGVNGVLPLT